MKKVSALVFKKCSKTTIIKDKIVKSKYSGVGFTTYKLF